MTDGEIRASLEKLKRALEKLRKRAQVLDDAARLCFETKDENAAFTLCDRLLWVAITAGSKHYRVASKIKILSNDSDNYLLYLRCRGLLANIRTINNECSLYCKSKFQDGSFMVIDFRNVL